MTKEATKVFRLYQLVKIRFVMATLLLLCLYVVALGGLSDGFLANPGDTNEVLSEIQQVREMISVLTEQVRSTCGCAAAMTSRCPDGWTKFDNSCYYFGVIPKSWQDAEVGCERLAHIWLPCNQQKRKKSCLIMSSVRETIWWTCRAVTWIGGHDFLQESNWRWITDEIFNFTN